MNKPLATLFAFLVTLPAFAATPIDLSKPTNASKRAFALPNMQMNELSRNTDFNQTLHVRLQETYQGYDVWGADAVLHVPGANGSKKSLRSLVTPSSFMNGIVYENLTQDLAATPPQALSKQQEAKAIAHVISLYQTKKGKNVAIEDQESKRLVFIDSNNQAHWAYYISFFVPSTAKALPEVPTYIIDAVDFTVYENWNNLQTYEPVEAGGFGGNHKTGKKIFDSLSGNQPMLQVERNNDTSMCYAQNKQLNITDIRTYQTMGFECKEKDKNHNDIYWNSNFDAVATTHSPTNDVLFGTQVAIDMFNEWYKMPFLINQDGSPMFISAYIHMPDVNAYWKNNKAYFGDSIGSSTFNPFTSLDTVVHEMGHGFTQQHSNLIYRAHSGGINEAFSDMVGIAAEYFAYGKTEYLVGWGDMKAEGVALRYMDKPSKDCRNAADKPGIHCSIDHISQYNSYTDVHLSSGLFNRVYYTLANSENWNPRKALDIMVKANANYWTATTTFDAAACGVMQATKDYDYNLSDVAKAFAVVGIDTKTCRIE